MDNKTVFVRTSKGEDEAHSRTMHLPGDIKRALLMVDGDATFGEISKRAAPSLRAGLDAMLQELEKDGYITDKSKAANAPRMAAPPKMVIPPRMVVPHKMAAPQKNQAVEDAGDLDFMSGVSSSASKAPPAEDLKAEAAEEKARQEIEIEAARFEAQQKAQDSLRKAEQEAARVREEAEREKQRIVAETHAREEASRRAGEEAARIKAEQILKTRLEAEAIALQQAEAARKKAEQDAAIAREAAERIASQERELAKAREHAEKRSRQETAARAAEAPQSQKPDAFTFDSFHVDESTCFPAQNKADQHERKVMITAAATAGKTDAFAFDSFQIDALHQPAEPPKKQQASPSQQPESAACTALPVEEQPVQHEAAKPAVNVPSPEEIEQATQERIAAEKRMEEEVLAAKKHAEAQAKVKAQADAKKRADETARAQMEQARQVKPSEKTPHAAKPAQAVRTRRQPFTMVRLVGLMFKLGVLLLVLLVGALFVAPYALPTRDYVPKVEKFLSTKLKQPVHIGRLHVRVLPTPRLELVDVYVGKAKQLQAEQALIYFSITGLVIETKPVNSIEFHGVRVSGAGLQNVSAWMQQLAADNQYPVESIVISQGTLDAGTAKFTGVDGTLNFNAIGEFINANLRSNGGKFILDMNAATGGKLNVDITVRGSALPLLPNWQFDELIAKGELSSSGLSISEFYGRILDGFLQGNASIDWHSGWRAQGNLEAKTITMQRLNKLLDGNVEGSARFKMSAVGLDGLADSVVLEGSFTSRNGVIGGVDIIETARTHSRDRLGGRTHFDELGGNFTYANNTLHLKQVKIASNVLNAVATLDIDKQLVSGSVITRLMLEEGMKPVNLQIRGATDRPTLHFAP